MWHNNYHLHNRKQWQFRRFTIGCDWFGIAKNVTTFQEEGDNFWDNEEVAINLVNFYIGMSF